MYEGVMGAAFGRLDAAIQRFHRLRGKHLLRGDVHMEAPASRAAQVLALCIGSPRRQQQGAMEFELHANERSEVWIRRFPGHTMTSELKHAGGCLTEKLGCVQLQFDLEARDGELSMHLRKLHFWKIPCPKWLMPRVIAEEHGEGDRMMFRVSAALPFVGTVAAYSGHLVVPVEG